MGSPDAYQKVAQLYRKRGTIETMFQDLTENLTCEIKTLAYPRAAVFAFCLAVMAWNGMSVIHAALRSVHGEETVEETVSGYYLALEISQVYHGMMIAIPAEEWTIFQNLSTAKMAAVLKQLASRVSLNTQVQCLTDSMIAGSIKRNSCSHEALNSRLLVKNVSTLSHSLTI